jgi:hypothetical protein
LFAALRPETYARYFLAEYQRRALSGKFKALSLTGWIMFSVCGLSSRLHSKPRPGWPGANRWKGSDRQHFDMSDTYAAHIRFKEDTAPCKHEGHLSQGNSDFHGSNLNVPRRIIDRHLEADKVFGQPSQRGDEACF